MKYIITKKRFQFSGNGKRALFVHTPQTYMFNTNQTPVYSFLFLNISKKELASKIKKVFFQEWNVLKVKVIFIGIILKKYSLLTTFWHGFKKDLKGRLYWKIPAFLNIIFFLEIIYFPKYCDKNPNFNWEKTFLLKYIPLDTWHWTGIRKKKRISTYNKTKRQMEKLTAN